MYCKRVFAALLPVLSVVVSQAAVAAEHLPPVSQWIPRDAVIVLEVPRSRALLDLAVDPKLVEAITTLPAYQKQASKKEFKQFLQLIDYLENRFDTDWRAGLSKLLGGGVTLAVGPGDSVLLAIDSEDRQMLQQLHEIFLVIAREESSKQGQPGRVASADYRGVTGWTFNGKEAHAMVGRRLLVANKPEALKAVLDLRASPDDRNLASLEAYQAAKKAAGDNAVATAFVNLGILKKHPPVAKALAQTKNPLVSLLFAGVTQSLRESSWLAAGVGVENNTLRLRTAVNAKLADPKATAAFAQPGQPDKGALPNLPVPRRIAAMSFYRDLRSFYAAKDELFPERTSGLIFFENMMGIFFSGRDLTDEVLAAAEPEVRVVVAEQEFDPAAEGRGPDQFHSRPEGPSRVDHRPDPARRNQVHLRLLLLRAGRRQEKPRTAI